ncbi:MAG: GspMb/PilO family protein [Kiritimatiellia bacterium]|nr:GspMb/PilO family protein [Kiritimatiellia bacterium]
MKITSRELVLGWMTGFTVLVALSFLVCSPKLKVWKELTDKREAVARRIEVAEHLVAQRGEWDKRLQDVALKLTKYPVDQDVTADYLKILETIVKENGVTLSKRQPQKEKKHNELYELAVDCTWEADLGSLIHFLHALEQQKVTMDIDDLSVSLVAGGKGRLKGNFTLICLYTRKGSPAAPAAAPAPAKITKNDPRKK